MLIGRYYGAVLLMAVFSFTCIHLNMKKTTQVSSKHKVQRYEAKGGTLPEDDVKAIQMDTGYVLTSETDAEDVLTSHACPWDGKSPPLDDKTKKKYEIYDILQMKKPDFLPNYKNPCWREGNTTKLVCLPYFFLVGFPKCGSSFTFSSIYGHPEVTPPLRKEPGWLSRTRFDDRPELKWYLEVFSDASSLIDQRVFTDSHTGERYHPMITGDGSTTAVWYNPNWRYLPGNYNCSEPRVLNQDYIYHLNPAIKIIIVIRDPTERIISSYNYFVGEHATSEKFHQKVVNDLRHDENCRSKFSLRACTYGRTTDLAKGMYHIFIKDWMKVFPQDQVYIARLEDFREDPVEYLTKIFKFLGLNPVSRSDLEGMVKDSKRNKREKRFQVQNETRRLLEDFYRPHNIALAKLFQYKFPLYR